MARILLVEDEHSIRFVTALNLQMYDYEVAEAWDGLEAQYLLCNGRVDLVITDLLLPYMNGLELITWLQREHDYTPVIAVSAHADSLNQAAGLGVDAVLKKPFAVQQMLQTTRAVLEGRIH